MESIAEKKKRILKRYYLKQYISILDKLLLCPISDGDLLSLGLSLDIYNCYTQQKNLIYKQTIKYDLEVLNTVLNRAENNFNMQCYLWIELSLKCGLCKINTIRDLHIYKEYIRDDPSSTIIIINDRLTDSLRVEIYEEYGEWMVDIERSVLENRFKS